VDTSELNEAAIIALPRVFDLASIEAMHPLACAAARRDGPVILDAQSLKEISAPGFQLIVTLAQQLRTQGQSLSFQNCSTEITADFRLLGLDTDAPITALD
jgi:anti-anti-sigma regulatory factor